MTKAIAKTYDVINENVTRLNYVFIIVALSLALYYAINIFGIVHRTVSIQGLEKEIAKVENTISLMNAKYISLSDKITADAMSQYGMKRGEASDYITRTEDRSLGMSGKVVNNGI